MKDEGILERVAVNIRRVREQRGLSQEKLAFLADLHRTTIGRIERVERKIKVGTLYKIAEALGVEAKDLL